MRVHPDDASGAEALAASSHVWVEGLGDSEVEGFGPHGAGYLLRLTRVRRVESAKRLVHARIWVEAGALAAAEPVAWVGLPVQLDGRELGTVEAVDGPAFQPLLRVRRPGGLLFLPANAPYVQLEPDVVRIVDPPEGLLELS